MDAEEQPTPRPLGPKFERSLGEDRFETGRRRKAKQTEHRRSRRMARHALRYDLYDYEDEMDNR